PGAQAEPGRLIHSGAYDGLSSEEGGRRMAAALAEQGLARPQVVYKLRDWLISRQRYWGAPIPIVHCPACGPVPVPEAQLPVLLPQVADFAPGDDGRSPLARVASWVETTCPQCGRPARRETDTLDGFACSSWYFLRFASPDYDQGPFEPAAMRYWLPVDTYVGGAEHAVMHLLYARFWTKVMHDAGLVPFDEPFSQLRNQGVLHADDGQRMSKSKGNVVTPDEVIAAHGTDALRAYILFIGPFEGNLNWDERNIVGVTRFLERFWRLAWEKSAASGNTGTPAAEEGFRRGMHRAIKAVTEDIEAWRFNTAVAGLMSYLNELSEQRDAAVGPAAWRQALEALCLLLAPIAPFISEEIWQAALGHRGRSVHQAAWPAYDPALAAAEEQTIIIQVNGKRRDQLSAPAGLDEAALRELALGREKVQRLIAGRPVRRTVVVPGQLVNLVVE
ncbi:MAG: class I tRNA ligase family protein, partial [Candidatus Promineifilaceae bacterium]